MGAFLSDICCLMAPATSRLRSESDSDESPRQCRHTCRYPFPGDLSDKYEGRRWMRDMGKTIRYIFSLQHIDDMADRILDPAVRRFLDACSAISSKLPTWFQNWFDFAIISVFENRSLRTTLPLFVVGTIISILYMGFVLIYLPFSGYSITSPLSVSFHAMVALAVMSYYKGIVTDPGGIPDSWKTLPHAATFRTVEKKKSSGDFRWCQKENKYKPDRAHFCTPLDRNILRMDHYCPWLSSCVGYYNYKYFFLFLLYTMMATNTVGFSLGKFLWTTKSTLGHTFFVWEVECLAGLLSSVITPFFFFHCWLMSKNMTTIEFCEKKRDTIQDSRSPYNVNLYHNIKTVLGSNPFAWFFPVAPSLTGDGLSFDVNQEWLTDAEEPEETGLRPAKNRSKSCWEEMLGDVHVACVDLHIATIDAAMRCYRILAGIK
eukprot:GEMP01010885.1.p1 GENE.GEMP01010885.1~~GEMP01010885.1.p1  ORF type:complete len:431 (+),score=47.61 GEMP01010885.1:439-1731(+)